MRTGFAAGFAADLVTAFFAGALRAGDAFRLARTGLRAGAVFFALRATAFGRRTAFLALAATRRPGLRAAFRAVRAEAVFFAAARARLPPRPLAAPFWLEARAAFRLAIACSFQP